MDDIELVPAVAATQATDAPRLEIAASVRDLSRLSLPGAQRKLRIQLHHRDVPFGKVDLDRLHGTEWGAVAERWVREEALPRRLPRFLQRRAWRDRRLLGRMVRMMSERRGRRYLWHTLHTPPSKLGSVPWRRSWSTRTRPC